MVILRQNYEKIVYTFYKNIGLTTKQADYVIKHGYSSPISLVCAYKKNKLKLIKDDDELPDGSIELLILVLQYCVWK